MSRNSGEYEKAKGLDSKVDCLLVFFQERGNTFVRPDGSKHYFRKGVGAHSKNNKHGF